MTAQPDLIEHLHACRADIDAALERVLPTPPQCPPVIADVMRYCVLGGGKRFRPILTLTTADAVDLSRSSASSRDLVIPAACAIELIHTYSLVHDDLPAMDNDTLRRGRATAHVVYGDGIAILAGDGLLTEAFHLLANEPSTDDPIVSGRKIQTLGVIAAAAGAVGMVGGQAIDLQASDGPATAGAARLDAEGLRAMHARKTGALIRAAAVAGATMAGASDSAVHAIDQYATHLGLAFQIVDDILDVEGASQELGKTAGKDAATGKTTYPSLYGLDDSRRLAAEAAATAKAALAAAGLEGLLPAIAEWVVSRTS